VIVDQLVTTTALGHITVGAVVDANVTTVMRSTLRMTDGTEPNLEKKLKAIQWYESTFGFAPCNYRGKSCTDERARAFGMQCDKEYGLDCAFYQPYYINGDMGYSILGLIELKVRRAD
jgi:hypothetical protein